MKSGQFLYMKLNCIHDTADSGFTLRGKAIRRGSIDDLKLRDAMLLWCLAMWDLAPINVRFTLYDYLPQLYYKLLFVDVLSLIELLDDMNSGWKHLRAYTSFNPYVFKGRKIGKGIFSGHVIVPLLPHCDQCVIGSFRILNTLLSFITRLNIKLDIKKRLESEYLDDERRVSSLEFDDNIVNDLNKIMKQWFRKFEYDDTPPRHGPGAVSEAKSRLPISEKYPLLGIDQRLEFFLRSAHTDYRGDYPAGFSKLDRTATVVFVPKSVKTYRVICKEPATLQYWQQSVASQITRFIHSHPYLGRKIDLSDQEKSRSFCLFASRSGDFATIDLSKASDSVSYKLVKKIFRGTPLLRALVATRSDRTRLPSGQVIPTAKFAPMGSALCFPIECIIFAALCELSIAYAHSGRSRYRIYGDDMIVHHSIVPNLMILLEKTGFLPNKEKSFYHPSLPFRESCGIEAYHGRDVSPVRLSRSFKGLVMNTDKDISRNLDLANTAFSMGLQLVRKRIVSNLLKLEYPPFFSVPNGIGVWSHTPTNFHLKRIEYGSETWMLHGTLVSKSLPRVNANESLRLHEWFRMGGNPEGATRIEEVQVSWQATSSPLWFSTIEVN